MWNSLSHTVRASALACTNVAPGTVSALLHCYILPTHFDGFLPDCLRILLLLLCWEVDPKACRSPSGLCAHYAQFLHSEQCTVTVALHYHCIEKILL